MWSVFSVFCIQVSPLSVSLLSRLCCHIEIHHMSRILPNAHWFFLFPCVFEFVKAHKNQMPCKVLLWSFIVFFKREGEEVKEEDESRRRWVLTERERCDHLVSPLPPVFLYFFLPGWMNRWMNFFFCSMPENFFHPSFYSVTPHLLSSLPRYAPIAYGVFRFLPFFRPFIPYLHSIVASLWRPLSTFSSFLLSTLVLAKTTNNFYWCFCWECFFLSDQLWLILLPKKYPQPRPQQRLQKSSTG